MKTWFLLISTFLLLSVNQAAQAQISRRLKKESFAHISVENKDAFTMDAYIGDDQALHIRITGAGKEEILLNIYNTKGKVIAHHKLNIAGNSGEIIYPINKDTPGFYTVTAIKGKKNKAVKKVMIL